MFDHISSFFKTVSHYQQRFFTWLFLQCIYILGIGGTAVVGKFFNAKFLDSKGEKRWHVHKKEIDLQTMY
jgi:hypothetical protein